MEAGQLENQSQCGATKVARVSAFGDEHDLREHWVASCESTACSKRSRRNYHVQQCPLAAGANWTRAHFHLVGKTRFNALPLLKRQLAFYIRHIQTPAKS